MRHLLLIFFLSFLLSSCSEASSMNRGYVITKSNFEKEIDSESLNDSEDDFSNEETP